MLDTYRLAQQAEVLESHGYRLVAEEIRTTLHQRNCCEQCGSKLGWNEEHYQETGEFMCPVCDGAIH